MPKPVEPFHTFTLRVPVSLARRVEAVAAAEGSKVNPLLRRWVERIVSDFELEQGGATSLYRDLNRDHP